MSISNVLSPNSRSSIQEWLIRAIEAEEELHENPNVKSKTYSDTKFIRAKGEWASIYGYIC